jgi:CO/xanthine dehydrogenase FAD-binding subunit
VDAARLVGSPQIRNRGTLGGNLANASPAGDSIPPLYVLDARVVLASADGTRAVPVAEFFTGPGQSLRAQHEIITAVELPVNGKRRSVFMRLGQRQALAISKVSIAVSLVLADETVRDVRIALGAVAPTVVRARRAEDALHGHRLENSVITAACAAAEADASPISDLRSNAGYRRAMCRELLSRALHHLHTQGVSDQ